MARNFYQGRTAFNVRQLNRFVAALPESSTLRARLLKCGTLSQVTHGYTVRCNVPACPSCRSRHATGKRKKVQELFAGADRDRCAHVTVVFEVLPQLGAPDGGDMDRAVQKARRDLRNFLDRMRAKSPRWHNMTLVGWLEVDALDPSDLPVIGTDRRELLSALGARQGTTSPLWVPTLHALVRFDDLGWQDLQHAFASQWAHPRQVKVEKFYDHLTIDQSVENLVSYALKHRCTTSIDGAHHPWPGRWMVEFYEWLDEWSAGLKRTQFKIGASRPTQADEDTAQAHDSRLGVHDDAHQVVSQLDTGVLDPMPIEYGISVFPSLY
jgi:hypothetical protein